MDYTIRSLDKRILAEVSKKVDLVARVRELMVWSRKLEAPGENSSDEDKDSCYDELEQALGHYERSRKIVEDLIKQRTTLYKQRLYQQANTSSAKSMETRRKSPGLPSRLDKKTKGERVATRLEVAIPQMSLEEREQYETIEENDGSLL